MKQQLMPELQEILEAVHYRPAISIIMPFEPKISLKSELPHSLKIAADKIEKEITANYPPDTGRLVMQKLRTIMKELNLNTHKKSIAIYVSPLFQKVLYLDIPVEERIMVADSFEIRDLVYAKTQLHKYLVLSLSYNRFRMYVGDSTSFTTITPGPDKSASDFANDIPERVANFSDAPERKEVLMEKFLRHIDNELDIIFHTYRLPLFVIGTKRIAGHFKKMTRHGDAVLNYIHGNYDTASPAELKDLLEPGINEWGAARNKALLNQIDEARGKERLVAGMKNVWREAMNNKNRLLIVEKDYTYPALHGDKENLIYEAKEPYNKFSYIRDAVDKVIEKVLETGGDVEFVDKDLLKKYDHIVLIQYY
ncbi:MAG: hypothetical protein AAB221_03660 [Bacteroidota bacterium]